MHIIDHGWSVSFLFLFFSFFKFSAVSFFKDNKLPAENKKKSTFSYTLHVIFSVIYVCIHKNTLFQSWNSSWRVSQIQFVTSLGFKNKWIWLWNITCKLTQNVKNSRENMLWCTSSQKLQLVIFFYSFN